MVWFYSVIIGLLLRIEEMCIKSHNLYNKELFIIIMTFTVNDINSAIFHMINFVLRLPIKIVAPSIVRPNFFTHRQPQLIHALFLCMPLNSFNKQIDGCGRIQANIGAKIVKSSLVVFVNPGRYSG